MCVSFPPLFCPFLNLATWTVGVMAGVQLLLDPEDQDPPKDGGVVSWKYPGVGGLHGAERPFQPVVDC